MKLIGTCKDCKLYDKERSVCDNNDHIYCDHDLLEKESLKKQIDWLIADDLGTSSLTIFCVMTNREFKRHCIPLDPFDFGRCYRLLKIFPEWKVRMYEVSRKYPEWKQLVEHWTEIETIYEKELHENTGISLETYNYMNNLMSIK